MIFALAVVVGIAWGIFHFLKKGIKTENDNDPFLRKVSHLTLSPGKSVQVITLQDNAFLIGVSDEKISLIGKIEGCVGTIHQKVSGFFLQVLLFFAFFSNRTLGDGFIFGR